MGLITLVVVVGLGVAAYAAYQLYKAKKAVTVASVVAQAKADANAVKKP